MNLLELQLNEHPFLKGIKEEYIKKLSTIASHVSYKAQGYLFWEGQKADRFFLIQKGFIALECYFPDRGMRTLQTISAGHVVGWSWICPPFLWHFSARVIEPVDALVFDALQLRQMMEEDHSLGYELAMRIIPLILERLLATRLQFLDIYGQPHAD
ncbi:cyclic nucleotide-binding domain-containing protein [Candidatus Methylacidiphilum infernorum]|uniref:Cyclic nucleotide-binding domain-containing protein n=1 Tax=Candidatus Methylacidiphilum infernorum TaxID=511746 RepID=A0ABX7PSD7_9BACT|nr:cyclic nucleotide-binding domain-containing protein [Candidatus Methylacidiphilum infernorum]QSR85911.1 cyclic nucleotide-binding domain-containing protein [Candidatus Methylacidiphilum infernorum]